MKTKTFLFCWLPAFAVVFLLNGLFHGLLAANFFDTQLSQLAPVIHKMSDTNPVWVGVLDLVLTFGMAYFITLRQVGKITLIDAAFTGALLNFISSGAWNFANAAMFDWSTTVIIGDMSWHVLLGAAGGLLIAVVYNYSGKKGNR